VSASESVDDRQLTELGVEEFLQAFSSTFDQPTVALSTRLFDDLDFDSIAIVEVALFVEELAEATPPIDYLPPELETVGDVFACYCELLAGRSRAL
jgi:acyl carrier protein